MGRNKVKPPEQASKVRMRMPTLRSFGEGRTRGEVIDKRTHAIRRGVGTACRKGGSRLQGETCRGRGSGLSIASGGGHGGSRTGQ
jgi:hypothetical protein